MAMRKEDRAALVTALSLNAGQAELSDPRAVFFPVPEHVRALEPDVVLIVGDRGAGKTQLVRALEQDDVRAALVRRVPTLRVPPGRVAWVAGWPLGARGPDAVAWRTFAAAAARPRDDLFSAWYAYLVRALHERLPPPAAVPLGAMLATPAPDVEATVGAWRAAATAATSALDALDEQLQREDRWLFVSYDELDTVVFDDWDALGTVIRGLVSLWAAYARRWRRLRPKVFLRSDFYKHHREVAGADVAKLAANRVELQWNEKNLYGALSKHVLNKPGTGEALRGFFKSAMELDEDATLGHVPRLARADDARPFVQRLVAEYMGANSKKGETFTWLIDHLRDGNGRALPRSLVWLIEFAAERERDDPRATGAHLLHHVSVRNALDKVSVQYVQHAETHELPWLVGLATRLQRDREVPWRRRELLRLLATDFDRSWGPAGQDARPPGQDPEEVISELMKLGVLRGRPDGSFDVPDLYLAGLGLTRRGGVARD
jgi:hypothetical protein